MEQAKFRLQENLKLPQGNKPQHFILGFDNWQARQVSFVKIGGWLVQEHKT
jgi:hypothetical protein